MKLCKAHTFLFPIYHCSISNWHILFKYSSRGFHVVQNFRSKWWFGVKHSCFCRLITLKCIKQCVLQKFSEMKSESFKMCCINIHLTVSPFTFNKYCIYLLVYMTVTYCQNKMLYNKFYRFVDVYGCTLLAFIYLLIWRYICSRLVCNIMDLVWSSLFSFRSKIWLPLQN